ncbi:membrane protein, putative [Crocosphaera watsonii WH 8501]|uniref:Membrane protein, putative n=1 Tax=Crocosphaera watsonii WH 8501 TaxID=165597 RepID=Q4C9W8_CROWT|nr:membrane protein, putative [Crocosphaera watsonii WH 8501]
MFPITLQTWLAVIGLGIISEGLGQRLLADCLDKFSSSFIAMFLLLEPIVSAMLAWFIFAEALSSITWIGFVIILTGIYLAQSSNAAVHEG